MSYFLDTCLISHYLKRNSKSAEQQKHHAEARAILDPLLNDAKSKLCINPLVYVETLRGIGIIESLHQEYFDLAKQTLDGFELLDIKKEVYEQVIAFSRFCRSQGFLLKGKCEAIDFIHFMTAKHEKLIMLSVDKDMPRLEAQYPKFLESLKNSKTSQNHS